MELSGRQYELACRGKQSRVGRPVGKAMGSGDGCHVQINTLALSSWWPNDPAWLVGWEPGSELGPPACVLLALILALAQPAPTALLRRHCRINPLVPALDESCGHTSGASEPGLPGLSTRAHDAGKTRSSHPGCPSGDWRVNGKMERTGPVSGGPGAGSAPDTVTSQRKRLQQLILIVGHLSLYIRSSTSTQAPLTPVCSMCHLCAHLMVREIGLGGLQAPAIKQQNWDEILVCGTWSCL